MTRRPLIAGNWKLNLGPRAASELTAALRDATVHVENVDIVVFPTALSVSHVTATAKGSSLHVGVQWTNASGSGAYTGTNSADMARELGCTWSLSGHSECRRDLDETNQRVNGSIHQALKSGLLPMMCLGESLEQRQAGQLEDVLSTQLREGLDGLTADQLATCTLAYEPIWAIGTGVTASPQQAQDAHAFIRQWLRDHQPAFVADQMRILYGGSVKPTNAAELMAHPDVDGALVGGASLKAESFLGIINAASL